MMTMPRGGVAARIWLWARSIRSIPVGRRIFLMVALNGLVMAVFGGLIIGGAGIVQTQWEEVRKARELDRLFVGIDSDIGRLQNLVHRYLHTPTDPLLVEIDGRQKALLDKLAASGAPDSEIAGDVSRLTAASNRFFGSFDALRDIKTRLRRTYDMAILNAGAEMPVLYTTLEAAARERNPAMLGHLGKAREAFADALLAATAFYLSADEASADRAERSLDSIVAAIPRMRAMARDSVLDGALDGVARRVELLRQAMSVMRHSIERQNRLVIDEVDGGQRAMASIIDRLLSHVRQRETEAERRFDTAIWRVGVLLGVTGLLFLTASAAVSWLIGQSIRRPLRSLMEAMRAIAGGDYSRPIHGTAVTDEIGAMARSLEVFKDNAIAKQAMERERDVQERRWRMMLETSPVGISIISAHDHTRLYSNPKFDAMFGLVGSNAVLGVPIADTFADHADARRLLDALRTDGPISGMEVLRRRADGTTWWCLLDVRPMEFDGGPAHIVWHYDITFRRNAQEELRAAKERAERALVELREMQESLIQAEKMAALGSLVAGVAHEINTPVGITVTAASHLADETASLRACLESGNIRRSELNRYVAVAEEASQRLLANAHRAAELIQSFKQVAVDQTRDDRRVFDLGQYINEILVSLGPRLRPVGHTVRVDCPEGLEVDGYPGPVAQVMTNLVMNSLVHAFEPGRRGAITIAVRQGPDDEVVLTYADDGKGIPPDILPRIFDPFFTTNRTGGGTGLGLNIVYNIVQQKLRGRINVESVPGQGARFTVRFPRRMGEG